MKSLLKIWWISLAVKLLLAAIIPLSADEAYYWVWSQRPQLSYFDHPPLVSWLNYLGQVFQGLGHGVRWPAVILGHCLLLFWLDIFKNKFSQQQNKSLLLLFLFSPLLGFGSLIVTPDLPVMFFWSGAIWATLRVLDRKQLSDYALLGLFLGLGFLSKYHIVLFVPCLLLYLTFEKKWKDVRISGVVLTLFFGLLGCSPVLLWNYQNEFQSFVFQMNHGFTRPNYKVSWTFTYILGQILILFPTVVWSALKAKPQGSQRFILYCAWFPLLFFFLTSFRALVEANWPIIAYPAVIALAVMGGISKRAVQFYLGFWSSIIGVVLATMVVPDLRKLNDKISEPYLYQEMAKELTSYNPLYGSSYQMSSSLWYFRQQPVYKLSGISRYDFFDTFPEAKPSGTDFYLVKSQTRKIPDWVGDDGWKSEKIKDLKEGFELLHFTR